MSGFTTNIINLITDNLRDRYHSGFPILKELIQNADDSQASQFIFGIHKGFNESCHHTLLQGTGIWCFNNGKFKATDKRAIRSFAENAKAGENGTIGKFGLGMKSVFHLCEAFFYVAFDGKDIYSEFLNPWDNGDSEIAHLHTDWDEVNKDDWLLLQQEFAEYLDTAEQWFLLWIPLRQRRHIQSSDGEEYGSIIANFPGDDLGSSLDFLGDDGLAVKLGGLLPLLSNLLEIQFVPLSDEAMWKNTGFSIRLDADKRMVLAEDSTQNNVSAQGYIVITANQTDKKLPFKGNKQQSVDPPFQALKQQGNWPKTRYRNEQGKEAIALDKSRAEGAVLISHQEGTQGKLTLQWAVFLPLEEKTHIVSVNIEGGFRHYHIVLHGQFFIDAGRRGIHEFQQLHCEVTKSYGQLDEQALRTTWNQALAQNVTLPLILQTLHQYVDSQKLPDKEVNGLTTALRQGLNQLQLLPHVCRDHVWFRELSQTGSRWQLHKKIDSPRILPLPAPPQDAPKRPWEVLPRLQTLTDTLFKDNDSTDVSNDSSQWTAEKIQQLLQEPTSNLFADAGQLDYFNKFLDVITPILGHGDVQQALMTFIRQSIVNHGPQRLRNNQQKISRVISHLNADKRWKFGTVDAKAQGNINDAALEALWQCQTDVFPVPSFLDSDDKPAKGKPNKETAQEWLKALQKIEPDSVLDLIKAILKDLEPKTDRLPLIRQNQNWKIVSAYDAKKDSDRVVSYKELSDANKESLLFSFAGMNKHEKIQLLAKCLSGQTILAIRSNDQELLFDNEKPPSEDNNEGILTALIKSDAGLTANIESRKDLLKKCHNINGNNKDAKQGLRYLLHANFDQKSNPDDTLWIKAHDQSPAWEKLQRKLIGNNHWQVIDSKLAKALPSDTWDTIGIKEIKSDGILKELKERKDIALLKAEDFSSDERNEILNKIDDKDLWCRLPWHKTIDGCWVSIEANTYLKTSIELPDSLKHKIKVIEPVSELAEKQKWIDKLDEAAAISIALNSNAPSEYSKEVINWLEKIKINNEIEKCIKDKKWLILSNNAAISPSEIIAIDGMENAIQTLSATADYAYASDKDLHENIRKHSAYTEKVKTLFATDPKDILEKLALLMNESPKYTIGKLEDSDSLDKLTKNLVDCNIAPAWFIIKKVIEKFGVDDCKSYLTPNLNETLQKDNLLSTLDWLQKKDIKQSKQAYNYYLRQMINVDFVKDLLPKIKLLAKDSKSWKSASDLCIDAPGVDDAFVLCDEQRSILTEHLQSGNPDSVDSKSDTYSSNIKDYLIPLESMVKPPLLGLLLSLLSRGEQTKVNQYMYPRSLDTLHKELQWDNNCLDLGEIDKSQWNIEYALDEGIEIVCNTQSSIGNIRSLNLLGNSIQVPKKSVVDNLILHKTRVSFRNHPDKRDGNGRGVISVSLLLCEFNDKYASQEDAQKLVKNTCEWLWTEVYYQNSQSLNQLWDKLSETHQLDIAVTRSVILKHAAFYLNTLGANKEPALKTILSDIQNCETRLTEAENNKDQSKEKEWQNKTKEYQQNLVSVLNQPNVINHVLAKVQAKLRDFQYETDSILFELFQNADDAVLQLVRCQSQLHEQCQQFHILERNSTLHILHWGRPINDRCNAEAQEKWPGFVLDLEKMLIISSSDKSDDKAVTGRFGLGFKSVFLACNSPKLISGDLKVNIIAGFLPEVWQGDDCIEAMQILREKTSNPRYQGTLVALPLRDDVEPESVLSRFQAQQVMLCMTAKMLRSITVNDHNFTWQPNYLLDSKKLEFGKLDGKHYLVFRDQLEEGYAAVIFHISARGFELLTNNIPSFWVVAPTRETASVGFVISAPFQIDAGRGKLAGLGINDNKNKELMEQLGKRLGFALADLYKTDWKLLPQQLQLAQNVTQVEWWTSLWKQFSDNDEWNKDDAPFHLAKVFVESLLTSWSENTKLIPNGLPNEQADLIRIHNVNHAIPKDWYSNNAIQKLKGWNAFDKNYPNGSYISDWVLTIWRKLQPDSRITELGLNNLIELIEDNKCGVELAERLGGFFDILYKTNKEKLSDDEKKQLGELTFLSQQDVYQTSSKLLSEHGADKEERLRVAFAPEQYLLSPKYKEKAKSFFRICRVKIDISDLLENWFSSATDKKQQAALRYIIEGEKGNDIAQSVRNNSHGKWFYGVSQNHPLLKDWSDQDKEELVRRLGSTSSIFQSNSQVISRQIVYAKTTLEEIYDWWLDSGKKSYLNQYYNTLFPYEIDLKISHDGGFKVNDWMILLSIASFQQKGRVKDVQNKGFIEYLIRHDWWKTFCKNPSHYGSEWINILHRYSETQTIDETYSLWLDSFPRMFKFSRWLKNYVELFESIDKKSEQEVRNVLISSNDVSLQGGGWGNIPPLNRTLKYGFNMVVRELLRQQIITSRVAYAHAYMPIQRIRELLIQVSDTREDELMSSPEIYSLLYKELGESKSIFNGDFDIPLLILSLNPELAANFDIAVSANE